LAVTINRNRAAQQEICFSKSFKRNCIISTGKPNLGVRCIWSWSPTKKYNFDSNSWCC